MTLTVTLTTAVALAVAATVAVVEMTVNFTDGAGDRTVVLLVSDYRSGSSLLGEMFNQNDDVSLYKQTLYKYCQCHLTSYICQT